jgi:hypothetical protein
MNSEAYRLPIPPSENYDGGHRYPYDRGQGCVLMPTCSLTVLDSLSRGAIDVCCFDFYRNHLSACARN